MNRYLLLADAVATIHGAYVAFVTVGFALIAIGIAMRWDLSPFSASTRFGFPILLVSRCSGEPLGLIDRGSGNVCQALVLGVTTYQ
jgi:hypothetical protein